MMKIIRNSLVKYSLVGSFIKDYKHYDNDENDDNYEFVNYDRPIRFDRIPGFRGIFPPFETVKLSK